MPMIRTSNILALLFVLLLVAGLGSACMPNQTAGSSNTEGSQQTTSSPGKSDDLGQFKTVDLSSKAYDYTMFYSNQLTMVNIWATWCGYCVQEMPSLAKLSQEYAGKGLVVVGILGDAVKSFSDPSPDSAAIASGLQIMKQAGVQYTVLQPDGILCKTLNQVSGYPTTLFVDNTGKIVDQVVGANSYSDWKKRIDRLLVK